ncbi:uncharacterized protein LOC143019638 [Oratosquilla oratoria]|uniref:uncharacterized protein LOC143019638 n=1 Tax=Oratosquilla oratoria TaxID=337810 RepID=UPI003F766E03
MNFRAMSTLAAVCACVLVARVGSLPSRHPDHNNQVQSVHHHHNHHHRYNHINYDKRHRGVTSDDQDEELYLDLGIPNPEEEEEEEQQLLRERKQREREEVARRQREQVSTWAAYTKSLYGIETKAARRTARDCSFSVHARYLCEVCAKETKSLRIYTECCSGEENSVSNIRNWCKRFINFGIN